MRRLCVLELNEIPLRVFRWHAQRSPRSACATLLRDSLVGESLAEEELPRDLYPSQSWATLSTGVPFSEHGVFWYGDAKPAAFPMYWQAAAERGLTTGVVGVLHSSPLQLQCSGSSIRFAIPDSFATEPDAIPARLEGLQAFNLAMTRTNSRAVTDPAPWRRYLSSAPAILRARVTLPTGARLAKLAAEVAIGKVPKERLRAAQFHLLADQFTQLSKHSDADLSVFFSNHIASAMHRYWFANFPDDWDTEIYDSAWVERFGDEIPYAMRSLDLWLERWMAWVKATNRTLLVISSMGQRGGESFDAAAKTALTLTAPELLAGSLGISEDFTVGNAMVPQVSFVFDSEASADAAAKRIADLSVRGISFVIDRREKTLTISYSSAQDPAEKFTIDGRVLSPEEMGFSVVPVSEHRAAVHDPKGSVIVYNSPTAQLPSEPFNYVELAPAILASLGVGPLPHHRATSVRL